MFSPIGKKRMMQKNYRTSKETGRPLESVTRMNSIQQSSFDDNQSMSMSSMGGDSFSSEDGGSQMPISRQRKKRPKDKKYLNPTKLDQSRKNGEKARQNAMRKLTHAAVRFRKDRDGVLLACFETRSLKYDEFRLMLKKVFSIEFTEAEYDEAFALFDTDGSGDVDGTEFLVYFTHLSTIYKKEEKAIFDKKKKDHEDKLQREAAQTEKAKHTREEQAVDYDYSDEDAQLAEVKLKAAAKHYIKGHPAAKNVDAFDVAYLTPFEFKNLCFQTFDLKLTPKEVGALVDGYDTDDKGLVDSPHFLVQFIKMGNDQRMVDHSNQVVLTRMATQELKAGAERKTAELEALLERGIEKDFTPEDQQNAVEKLRVAATRFDKNHPSSLSLDGFNSVRTTPGIFREMLKRTFNLILPARELGALVKFFDTDNTDTVNNSDFLTYFTRASTTGRFAMRSYMIARQRKMIQDAEEEKHRLLNAQWGKLEERVKFEFTAGDQSSAVHKLTDLARKHFNDKVSGIGLKAFQIAIMGPAVWREMMKRSFGIKITHGELAYFISIFGNSRKEIDCIQFVMKFNALVFAERAKGRTHQLKLDSDRAAEERLKDTARLIAERKRNESMISYDYTQEDTDSAMRKFRAAALKHDKNHPAAVSLDAFEVASMPAVVFQELCRRVFRMELTGKELGSIVHLCGQSAKQVPSPSRDKPREKIKAYTMGSGAASGGGSMSGTIDNSDIDSVTSGRSATPSLIPARAKTSHSSSRIRATTPPLDPLPVVPDQAVINCNEFMLMFAGLQRAEKSTVRSQRAGRIHEIKRKRKKDEEKMVEKGRERAAELIRHTDADAVSLMTKLNQAAQTYSMDNAAYLMQLQSYKGPSTTAASFRDTFFRIFLIRVSFAEVGALTNVLNPELAKESLVNGNTFLTAFYKLSRCHEKILLGMPLEEDINDINILRISQGGVGGADDISALGGRSSSGFRTAPSTVRRSNSRGGSKLPRLAMNPAQLEHKGKTARQNKSGGRRGSNKNSKGVGTDMLSSFKYSGVFSAANVDEYVESRAPTVETEEFPFTLNSPRRGFIELNQAQLPSPFVSRAVSPRGGIIRGGDSERVPLVSNGGVGMLATMFSGINPWTASQEDLGSIGLNPPQRYGSPSSPSRTTSPNQRKNKSPNKQLKKL